MLEFLKSLRPGGPWVLTAIIPDGSTETETCADESAVLAFVERHNGKRNIYYSVNPTRTALASKAKKSDIARIEYIPGDLDPNSDESPEAAKARYLAQINGSFTPKPTAVIDSGNGIQCLWRLAEPIVLEGEDSKTQIADVEARSKAIMEKLGAKAGTQNIDRVLRLPGTTNIPNKKKRDAGRVECPTSLLFFNGSSYSLDVFPLPEEKKKHEQRRGPKRGLRQHLRLMLYMQGDHPAGYESRSELFFAFINAALRAGIADDHIVEHCLDNTYAGCSIYTHVDDNGGEAYVKAQIERIINEPTTVGEKQIVRLASGQLDKDWRATENALLAAKCPVYVRGGRLVQPLYRWEDTGEAAGGNEKKQILSCSLVKYTLPQLSDMVQHHAVTFQKFDKKQNTWQNIDPPENLIERLLTIGHWGFPNVRGIVTSPTMRPDGTIITEPGYDAKTQLWYKPAGDVELPAIPERPTKEDARQALEALKELVEECPFADKDVKSVDRAAALAGMMTVVLRGAFKVAPLFFVSKPEAGTGGSYLVKIISNLALGRDAVPLKASEDPKELDKELTSAAYEAKPIINLNNLTFDLKSSMVAQMVTEGIISFRPFFKNTETAECDCRATTVFVNGNNINIVGELVRRTIRCRLDAKMEHPEEQTFKGDPIAAIKNKRGYYLGCVFTIVRAFMNSEAKVEYIKKNDFEDWSKYVQRPLIWLGEADPMKSQEEARVHDPERGELRQKFEALAKHFPQKEFIAADVHQLGSEFKVNSAGMRTLKYPELNDAFDCLKNSSKSIGWELRKCLNRQVGNYRLDLVSNKKGEGKSYMLVVLSEPGTSEPEPVTSVQEEEDDVPF